MEIGGTAVRLTASADIGAADAVLRVCHSFWPRGVFRDGDGETDHGLDEVGLSTVVASSREFFVCRDADASTAWDNEGPTDANENAMLHFIIAVDPDRPHLQNVTMVYDKPSDEIRRLTHALSAAFQSNAALRPETLS